MKLNKIIAAALAVMMVGSTTAVAVSAADENSTNKYEAQAAQYDKQAYYGGDLGANYTPTKTTFKLWSPSASDVTLNLYSTGSNKEAGSVKLGSHSMVKGDKAVWEITIEGDLKNVYYTYSVTNNKIKIETADPYARAAGVNGDRSMVVDLNSTDPQGWENDNKFKRVANQSDATVWEVHVKDFTYDKSSGVSDANRGKYLGFTEKGTTLDNQGKVATGMDYLADLGVNYVQITPFYDYGSVDEAGPDTQFNWGYDPKNYNVPEGSYSSNPYDGNVRINEAKQMIKSIHDNGMGVIMDVVYNHTYSTNSVFQNTVPDYYYRMNPNGAFSSGSGCGNDTASEREMYRQYMINSVVYWATEYHVDGFRFDLMGLHDVETMNMIREALDKVDPDIIMYGEGWTMTSTFDKDAKGATQANAKLMSSRIGFFNDQIRDSIKGSVFSATGKGYIQGELSGGKGVALGMLANTSGGAWRAQAPEQTVTYASCHDNATIYDRLVYSCGGDFTERYDNYVEMNKLSAAITFGSQGTSFILAGEEFARTKLGDENSYKSSPDLNKLDWNRVVQYGDLVSYYKGLLEFREYFAPVRTATALDGVTSTNDAKTGIVQTTYANQDFAWKNLVMLFNNATEDQTVELDSTLPDSWVVVVNGQQAGVANLGEVSGRTITVPAGEALFLVDKASYTASGVKSDKGVVEVRHIDEATGEVMSTVTMAGEVGDYYFTQRSNNYDLYYNASKVVGDTEGTYTEGTKVVEYYYAPNVVKFNDVNGDNKVSLADAIMVQKAIIGLVTLTDEQASNADINMNGQVDLADAVLIMKELLGYDAPYSLGTVTVQYVDEAGNKLKADTVSTMKAGADYTAEPVSINYYRVIEDKLPTNATGKVSVGNTTVTYVYKLDAVSVTMHVQMPEGTTKAPNLYVWEEADGQTTEVAAWPGTPMTDADGDGWYEVSFATSGTYNWIINDGTSQTKDMKGFSGDQWVVMEDIVTPKVVTTTVNVKLADGVDLEPNLYVWQTTVQTGAQDFNPLGNWSGKQMTDFDKDGWYTINFYCKGEGQYNWIVNYADGAQTADYTDYSGNLWIVMADKTTAGSVTPENPEA
ncbi:MAG: type I pullulanase [Acutalibacteraceae bacterium]|nr:type I pullulanase [Acutalibacteraceae bacterium]